MKKQHIIVLSLVLHISSLPAQSLLDTLHQKVNAAKRTRESASTSASPETLVYQELQDYVQSLSRFADEAQQNFSSFATKYGFVKSDGGINTQAMTDALKTIEQEITPKTSTLQQKKEEITQQIKLHTTTMANAIDRYLKTITPVKQLVTTPLDHILKKLAAMSSSTQAIEVVAQEQGFTNPDGSVKIQLFIDALAKMEKEALEFGGKISPQKKEEIQKTIEPQLIALRKKLEDYKIARPETAPTPAREPAPIAPSTPPAETGTPAAQPTTPETPAVPEASPSLESEPSLQPPELPGI